MIPPLGNFSPTYSSKLYSFSTEDSRTLIVFNLLPLPSHNRRRPFDNILASPTSMARHHSPNPRSIHFGAPCDDSDRTQPTADFLPEDPSSRMGLRVAGKGDPGDGGEDIGDGIQYLVASSPNLVASAYEDDGDLSFIFPEEMDITPPPPYDDSEMDDSQGFAESFDPTSMMSYEPCSEMVAETPLWEMGPDSCGARGGEEQPRGVDAEFVREMLQIWLPSYQGDMVNSI